MSAPAAMKAGTCNASRKSAILTTSVTATWPRRRSAGTNRPLIRMDRRTAAVTTMQLAGRSIYGTAKERKTAIEEPPQLLPRKLEDVWAASASSRCTSTCRPPSSRFSLPLGEGGVGLAQFLDGGLRSPRMTEDEAAGDQHGGAVLDR